MTKIELTSEPIAPAKYDADRPYCEEGKSLDTFHVTSLTTEIGDDFGNSLDLSQLLDGRQETESLLRDLAIRVSRRGVCVFQNQTITYEQQKELVVRMAHITGSPTTSHLHAHPVSSSDGGKKFELSSGMVEKHGKKLFPNLFANFYWHVDSTFEPVGPAYSCLQLLKVPENGGGDTLWCSLFDCCDKISPSLLAYLETLTATHDANWMKLFGENLSINMDRGSPGNSSQQLTAIHPVIATHPVTGWKALNVNRAYTVHINGISKQESDHLLEYLFRIISDNHDIQVRHRWSAGDIALWDNRSVAHCVTNDYYGKERYGIRVMSIGEKPVCNYKSSTKSKRRND